MAHTAAALHVTLLAGSAAVTAGLAGYAWRRRDEPGAFPFGLLMLATAVWSVSYAAGLLTPDHEWRVVWQGIQWFPIATIPVWFLLFALEYTGNDELATAQVTAALLAVPATTVALVWTNGAHRLVWTETSVVVVDGLALLVESFGPWFWVYLVYGYGLILIAGALLVRLVFRSDSLFTDQSVLLLIGTVTPLAGNAVSVFFSLSLLRGIDLTPYGFTVTGLAFGAALFRHRLFDLIPAAYRLGRDAAIRDMEEGVLILDTDRRVIYTNPAAADLLDCDPGSVTGTPVETLIDVPVELDREETPTEWSSDDRVFEIRTSPIRDRRDRTIGHTLVLQEVTTRKRREQQLARQRDELERLEQLNIVIRSVNRALVSATSRDEIERVVCDRLADSDRYRTVCVADLPTWNGDADRWTIAGSASDASSLPTVLREDGVAPEANGTAPTATSVPAAEDVWTIVPIAYGRTVYGALGLCAREAPTDRAVTDREREVLAELGESIGHAIDAVENRRLLAAESVLELDFRSGAADGTLLSAATRAECRLEVTGLVPDAGDGHLAYVQVVDGDPAAAADELGVDANSQVRQIRGEDANGTPLLEWLVPRETLLGTLIEQGAHVLAATAGDGNAHFRVEVAADADVRALVDRLRETFPKTWLEAKHERDRPAERADSISEDVIEDLTDRQQQALEAAYRAGYFAWPRESTAEDIAETLDIAPPTLHGHLRKAEHELFADLFDRERRPEWPGDDASEST